jgi:pyrimidine and pyridine-specific 5'-nucleotidase
LHRRWLFKFTVSSSPTWQLIRNEQPLAYMKVSLDLSDQKASQLRGHYYAQYGLTFRGLRLHHGIGNVISSLFLAVKGFFLTLGFVDPIDYDEKCDGSIPLEKILEPNPQTRRFLEDIDRSRCRVWALTNAYRTVRPLPRDALSTQHI